MCFLSKFPSYVLGSWATNDELAWAHEHCPDRFKKRNAIARATHSMVEYTAANEAGISIHDPDAFYGGQPPTMPLLARLGAVCGGISKFGSAMAQAHGVPATPVGQPEHCAFVWSLGRRGKRASASSSCFARLDNKNCEWDRTTRHGGSQMPWDQAPWALPLMEQCQASYAAHCRTERLLALAPLVPLAERADYLASVSAASPQHVGVWLARIACVRQQARAAAVAAASAGLDAVHIASAAAPDHPRPWMVAARQAVLATSSVDAVVSRARAVLVSECSERGDNLVKPDGSEWWCEQPTAWFQIDLGEPHRIAGMRLHWWGHSVAATYAVLASTDGVAWTRQRSHADATDSGEALNNWHRVCYLRSVYFCFRFFSFTTSLICTLLFVSTLCSVLSLQLPGWDSPTRFVRVELADGRIDPWFSQYLIGLRCCELSGRPLDLVARAAALGSPREVLRAEMRLRLASPPPSHASAVPSAVADGSEEAEAEEEEDDDQDQAANEASWRSAAVSHLERLLDFA